MNRISQRGTRLFRLSALAVALATTLPALAADDAEVVMIVGNAESRPTSTAEWARMAARQKLLAGSFVRTSDASQAAIVLSDQTQIRLNERTVMRIAAVGIDGDGTSLELERGRAWTQAKQYLSGALRSITAGIVGVQRLTRSPLRVTTPTATVGIRGTDWELSVEDGKTTVTVLSGEVELANNMGAISVGPNEQGVAEAGKAPVKTLLSSARDRVQWVTAYRPAPRRWVPQVPAALEGAVRAIEGGDYAAALPALERSAAGSREATILLADMRLFQGRAGEAATLLAPLSGDAAAVALRMRALVIAGRLDEARALAAGPAPSGAAGNVEYDLARADLARIDGNAEAALRIFGQVAAAHPQNADAPFGSGRVQGERDNIRAALPLIDTAIRLLPDGPGYLGERATIETQANDFAAARASFDAALQKRPDDYLALTGLGILQLKTGATSEALETFLKAGVIEPRFARAQLYTGVAYYRLGNRERALETVKKAAELDPKDPLPWVMLSMMQGDALELGAAADAAREAQVRMPYLKSLNQILNDQKGSANLGSSLSNFGLEEWATFYANEAYSPYWAGSHLFAADRHTGQFNKNSELFKGFITDPTVFGASNRFSSLVAVPGHYARADLALERNNTVQATATGTFNGLVAAPVPIAYYVSGDLAEANWRKEDTQARGGNLTVGFGAKPRYDIGVFAFGTDSAINAGVRNPTLPSDPLVQKERRGDLGFNFKLAPDNQFWFKTGDGKQQSDVDGPLFSPTIATSFDRTLSNAFALAFVHNANARLDRFHSEVAQHDHQFRHAFSSGSWQWTWGAERSRQERGGELVTTFNGLIAGVLPNQTYFRTTDVYSVRASDAYLAARVRATETIELEGDLFAQEVATRRTTGNLLNIRIPAVVPVANTLVDTERSFSEINPRLGVKWRMADGQFLRLVGQKWRRPASAATLAPIDTLGIALGDRLPTAGGLYQRTRLQYDAELSARTFAHAFLDQERVDNGLGGVRSAVTDFEVTQLQSLRNKQDVFTAKPDLEQTPLFINGRVNTLGLAVNHRVSGSHTVSLRYLYRESRQGGGATDGLAVPYIPKNYLLAGSQWALPGRWLLGATAAYRSLRFRDDTNQDAAQHGWSYGLTVYWESADKRASVQAILDNLLSRTNAATLLTSTDARLLMRFGYRF